jgi:hypothetical protein
MNGESCGICGGDGRIANAFGGGSKRCPACNGTGRKSEDTGILRDVTKTKASHFRPQVKGDKAPKQTWPSTYEGGQLAKDVQASSLSEQIKSKLIREIIEYETSHGTCTQTFIKKIRKQVRPRPS